MDEAETVDEVHSGDVDANAETGDDVRLGETEADASSSVIKPMSASRVISLVQRPMAMLT